MIYSLVFVVRSVFCFGLFCFWPRGLRHPDHFLDRLLQHFFSDEPTRLNVIPFFFFFQQMMLEKNLASRQNLYALPYSTSPIMIVGILLFFAYHIFFTQLPKFFLNPTCYARHFFHAYMYALSISCSTLK